MPPEEDQTRSVKSNSVPPSWGARAGGKGKGLGGGGTRRHRKVAKDTIRAVTKRDIRRLARRGGIQRMSPKIYDVVRVAVLDRIRLILRNCATCVEHSRRKTITVSDVVFVLNRLGNPVYGFRRH